MVLPACLLGAVAAGGKVDADFLARLALLLATETGDPERVLALVAAAEPEPSAGR